MESSYTIIEPSPPKRDTAYWQETVQSWRTSGLSQKQFCQEQHIHPNTFGHWKKKFLGKRSKKITKTKKPSSPLFVPVSPTVPGSELKICLPNGLQIQFYGDLNSMTELIHRLAR